MCTVGTQKQDKLNQLQKAVPEGLVVDARWLEQRGYSRELRRKYVTSGWLESPAHGVFRRPLAEMTVGSDSRLTWEELVVSLQHLLETELVVGGRTALELRGFGHYISRTGPGEVHLYGPTPAPSWAAKVVHGVSLRYHNSYLLFPTTNEKSLTAIASRHRQMPLVMSCPERAALEVMAELPVRESFEHVDVLMGSLATLSPRRVQELLEACRSVKAKRLFLWFAERHRHAWLKRIVTSRIDLGRGKRLIVRGGRLDPKYHITVPADLDSHEKVLSKSR